MLCQQPAKRVIPLLRKVKVLRRRRSCRDVFHLSLHRNNYAVTRLPYNRPRVKRPLVQGGVIVKAGGLALCCLVGDVVVIRLGVLCKQDVDVLRVPDVCVGNPNRSVGRYIRRRSRWADGVRSGSARQRNGCMDITPQKIPLCSKAFEDEVQGKSAVGIVFVLRGFANRNDPQRPQSRLDDVITSYRERRRAGSGQIAPYALNLYAWK